MRRILTVVAALLLPLGAITACDSGRPDDGIASIDGVADGASDAGHPGEGMLAWAQCMRDHGVDVPDPHIVGREDPDGNRSDSVEIPDGVDDATLQRAMETCRGLGLGDQLGSSDPKQREALLEWARCMREHGVEVPDPDPDGGYRGEISGPGGTVLGPGGIDPDTPGYKEAMETCRHVFEPAGDGE